MKCIFATLSFLFVNLALLKGQELYKFLNFAFQKENDVEIGQANYLAQFGYGIGASDSIVFKELQVNLGYINLAGARKNLTASLDFVLKKIYFRGERISPFIAVHTGFGYGRDFPYRYATIQGLIALECGAHFKLSENYFVAARFGQAGLMFNYLNKHIPSSKFGFAINDRDFFPVQFSIGKKFGYR